MEEAGLTSGKDVAEKTTKKNYLLSGIRGLHSKPLFIHIDRMTLMTSICPDESVGTYMFLFKGTGVWTRTIKKNGKDFIDTIADCLPRHALLTVRPDVAGCDKKNILEWAKHFVKSVEDLTAGS